MTPAKYKEGDVVRISKYKNFFLKSNTPNWTTEILKVTTIQNKHSVTYLLEDYAGTPTKGGF